MGDMLALGEACLLLHAIATQQPQTMRSPTGIAMRRYVGISPFSVSSGGDGTGVSEFGASVSVVELVVTDVAETEAIADVTPAALASLAMVLSSAPLDCAELMVLPTVVSMLSGLKASSS